VYSSKNAVLRESAMFVFWPAGTPLSAGVFFAEQRTHLIHLAGTGLSIADYFFFLPLIFGGEASGWELWSDGDSGDTEVGASASVLRIRPTGTVAVSRA